MKIVTLFFITVALISACSANDGFVEAKTYPKQFDLSKRVGQTLSQMAVQLEIPSEQVAARPYISMGVGGGGALSGYSISPYSDLRFVGTDMGTLFRSIDTGSSWEPVNHFQTTFSYKLNNAVSVGFASDGMTVFHAAGGINPQRSIDQGVTFSPISLPIAKGEIIRYWHTDTYNSELVLCSTTKGLYRSKDRGDTWQKVTGIWDEGVGTFTSFYKQKRVIYHAVSRAIYISFDGGITFEKYFQPSDHLIRKFTGGADASGVTLAYISNQGEAAAKVANKKGISARDNGLVLVEKNNTGFVVSEQFAGDHIAMAENDANTIYVTGARVWGRGQGTRVYLSEDAGNTWSLGLHQYDWDTKPYSPWPQNKLEYSAVALDVGWFDSGYRNFVVNKRNSKVAGGAGNFFLHSTENKAKTWDAPFTQYKDKGPLAKGKKWITQGIEVVSVYDIEPNPYKPKHLYAALADIAGMVSDDHGESFSITKAGHNSHYDYAFDKNDENTIFVATGDRHDWPHNSKGRIYKGKGGIFRSTNKGLNWQLLTPKNTDFNQQYLSVAYDSKRKTLYAGTQGAGIIKSVDAGKTWVYYNYGLPAGGKMIPQIEIDPNTGNVYALLSGDAPKFSNHSQTGIYFLDVKNGKKKWLHLRGYVKYPEKGKKNRQVWAYPTGFAINFNQPEVLWMIDYEKNGNWMMTGVWKSTDNGNSWRMQKQYTHPTSIKIDPENPDYIITNGLYKLSGSWGNGGVLYTSDGGQTWQKDMRMPLQANGYSVAFDLVDTNKIFYGYFGGGILYTDKPN